MKALLEPGQTVNPLKSVNTLLSAIKETEVFINTLYAKFVFIYSLLAL